jgi:hypothetical protein
MFSYFPGAPGLSVAVDSAVFEDLRSRGSNGSGGTWGNRIRYFPVGHDFNALQLADDDIFELGSLDLR